MAKTHEKTKKQVFVEGLSSFLNHNKWKLLIFAVVLVAVIIGLGLISSVGKKQIEKSALLAEDFQEEYSTRWLSSPEDDPEREEIKSDLKARGENIIKKYPKMFAAQRALFILGRIAYDESLWAESAGYFLRLADNYNDSYLAPVALMQAAAALEEEGKPEEALTVYQRVVDSYPEALQESLRASFNTGRILEGQGSLPEAAAAYEWVIEKGEQDPWALLAKSRLLILK